LVPVELQGGGQVVDLGHVDVVRTEPGPLVGRVGDGVPERPGRGRDDGGGVGGDVGQAETGVGKGRRDRGHGGDPDGRAAGAAGGDAPAGGVARRAQHGGGGAVGGGADVEQVQRCSHHRR